MLGCDPGFAKFGMALTAVNLDTMTVRPIRIDLAVSKKNSSKQVLVSSDDVRRISDVRNQVVAMATQADLIMSEVPSGGAKSHAAAKAMAYATAILASVQLPLIQVTPLQVKFAATGDKHASKAEMIAWAREKHGALNWTKTLKDEHMADALAAVYAGIESEQFLTSTVMMRSLKTA